ncbi:MAG TPA: ATP-binding protein, partial [Pseudonocardiaceae bacterium]|nr:ATP-binding protein [Pseudonocardiaceae bacterium]
MSLRARITLLVFVLFAATAGVLIPLLWNQFESNFAPVPSTLMFEWAAGIVAAASGLTWLVLREVLRPLDNLAATARELDTRQLSRRVELTSTAGEFQGLTVAVNGMLDRLAQGYDGQSRFAANASHELRTPLAVQRTLIEVAMEAPDASDDVRRLGTQLLLTNARNEQLIDGMLVLAECDQGLHVTVPVRLDTLAARVAEDHAQLAAGKRVTIEGELAPCVVHGDPVLLERLLTNLVQNAIKYNVPDGHVWMQTVDVPNGQVSRALWVRNTGPLIPDEMVPALLEPFRRMASERTGIAGGAGLGLSIVRSIVAAHGGQLQVTAGETGGLITDVALPGSA